MSVTMALGDDGEDIVGVRLVRRTSAKLQCAARHQWHSHSSKRWLATNFVVFFIVVFIVLYLVIRRRSMFLNVLKSCNIRNENNREEGNQMTMSLFSLSG